MLKHRYLYPFFIGACLLTLLVGSGTEAFYLLMALVLFAIGFTAWGVFDIRQGYFIPTYFRKKGAQQRLIALTFDDGPSLFTTEILQLLKDYQFKATFFCIGKQVQAYPDTARQLVEEGHVIANHSYTHTQRFGFLNRQEVLDELEQCEMVIEQTTGKKTTFFRPPFGVTNPSIAKAVKQTAYQVIGWSNRSLDTVTSDADRINRRVRRKLKAGDIILFHDTSARTVAALKKLLPYLEKKGYVSISVDDLLNLQAYEE